MQWVYLDNNATTQPAPEVVSAMAEVNEQGWANPSSVHRFGQAVRHRVELARAAVASLIHARPRQIVFTAGGTESNNLAINGLLDHTPGAGARAGLEAVLITTRIEHSAVREPAEAFEATGGTVVWVEATADGRIDVARVAEAVAEYATTTDRTILVSIQWANNETGVIQPMAELVACVERARAAARSDGRRLRLYLHTDATQAVGKICVNVEQVAVDLLTLSAHKLHGPKGVGALYVGSGVRLRRQICGGPQERQLRGGTENTAGIVGLGVAAELAGSFLDQQAKIAELAALRDRFERTILEAVPGSLVNSAGAARLWNTANIGFSGLEAEAVLLGLSEQGVCASAGAACSSGSLDPSPVLLAMGVPEPIAHGSVRFSLSRLTGRLEIDQAIRVVRQVVRHLSQTMPVG